MKKAFIILTLCVFLAFLLSNALAIERIPKKDTSASKEQKEEATPAPAPEKKESIPPEKQAIKPEPGPEQPKEGEVRKPQKERDEGLSRILKGLRKGLKEEGKDKYDYFIDKNGNGIDDRLEQQGKTEKKPEERKAPPEKKERRGR